MAQETVLKISLKEYKQGIDELRASLLGLDKDSEEYSKIVEQIAERQDKLNDVMNAGKQTVNAVDGSYNALAQTLSQLKKEWKNMKMGTPEWEAMAVRINDINNQLKDADASVGVFTRNVGDYANAFEEAFKQAAGGLGKMPGLLGEIGSMTNRLIPLIQKANTTATTGLKGVKKALVSTGIGALIVAVGMLIAHFDDLRKMFKKDSPVEEADKRFKELETSINKSNAEIEREIKLMEAAGASTQDVIDKKIELLRVQKSLVVAEGLYIKSQIDEIEKHSKIRRWIAGENKDLEDLKKRYEELYQQDQKYIELIADAENSKEADKIRKRKAAADEEKKKLDEVLKKVKENSKSEIQTLTDKYKEEYALLKKYGKDATELTKQYEKQIADSRKKALDSVFSELGQYNPAAALQWNFEEASDEVEKFQKIVNRKFPPEGLLKVEDVTEDMIKQAQELKLVQGDTALEFTVAWQNAYQKYKSIAKDLSNAWYENTKDWEEAMKKLWDDERYSDYYDGLMLNTQAMFNLLQEDFKDFSAKLKDIEAGTFDYAAEGFDNLEQAALWYKTLIPELEKLIDKYGKDIEDIAKDSAKYENELINLENTRKKNLKEIELIEKEFGRTKQNDYYKKIEDLDNYYKQYLALVKETEERIKTEEFKSEEARAEALEELNRKKLDKIEWFEQEREKIETEYSDKSNRWQWFSNTSRFYEVYQARLDAAIWYRDNLEIIEGETAEARKQREIEAEQAIYDIKREYAQKHIEMTQTLNSNLLSVWDSAISIRESQLKQEENAEVKSLRQRLKAQGKGEAEINEAVEKVRDEYGRKAFEESKKSKISLGWVETIQGALAAFMGYQDFPQPYGAILGAAAAAATMAAGVAQIEAIKATEYGEPSNSSSPMAVVNATPRLTDYSPEMTANLTGASETQNLANALQQTPIYVSVTDINAAQVKVSDRNNESSF